MKISGNTLRMGIATVVIVGTVTWLALSGYSANKSYYVTIAELGGMGDKAYHSQLRVEGFVVPGSIEENGTHVTFELNEFESHSPKASIGRILKVTYKGSEPPPDTFKDARRRWPRARMAAMECSMRACCRPSAPANTRHRGRTNRQVRRLPQSRTPRARPRAVPNRLQPNRLHRDELFKRDSSNWPAG